MEFVLIEVCWIPDLFLIAPKSGTWSKVVQKRHLCRTLFNPFTPGRVIWPNENTVKNNYSGGKVQNIVNVLMAVFNSLRFHLNYLTKLPLKIVDSYGF